jgi:hypothetical protein
MWKFISSGPRVLQRRLRAALAVVALTLLTSAPGHAAVEYVKICSIYGAGFFYIPGTDTCLNANQILTGQFAIARQLTRASTGSAMATSLVNPWLPDGTNYAVSTHWAVFDGQHAVGAVGMVRLYRNLSLSAGLALGLDQGRLSTNIQRTVTEYGVAIPAQSWSDIRVLGRIGLQYSW